MKYDDMDEHSFFKFSDEFIEGERAFQSGLKIDHNPYDPVTQIRKFNDWRFGYWEAESWHDYVNEYPQAH